MNIPFIDLRASYIAQKQEIDSAISTVLSGGWYILGDEVEQFEKEFATYCDCPYAVGVASGTDALLLALKAFDIGPGDEVITVSHTAVATATAIEQAGAKPLFVDIHPQTYTMNPDLLPLVITPNTRAIIPVHLYGQPANMDPILKFAAENDLIVIEDCAQAHGAKYKNQRVGSLGHAGAFSFYPTKNLGAIGDGGAVVCRDRSIANRLGLLRQYGWKERYISEEVGFNSRLDEMQAAILRVKLPALDRNNELRRQIADSYKKSIAGLPVKLPLDLPETIPVYHLFVIQLSKQQHLRKFLKKKGIGSAVHYPVPVHRQPAYQKYGLMKGTLPVTEQAAREVISLPMYPQLTQQQQQLVIDALYAYFLMADE